AASRRRVGRRPAGGPSQPAPDRRGPGPAPRRRLPPPGGRGSLGNRPARERPGMPRSPRVRPLRARLPGEPAPRGLESERYYLVVDRRFLAPVYVFLAQDPHEEPGFPGLGVREVTLALQPAGQSTPMAAIGADPAQPGSFREFPSDRHARAAGFTLIEPRYV